MARRNKNRNNKKRRRKRSRKNQQRKPNSTQFVSAMTAGKLGLSKCAADYLDVLIDPFSGRTACVPSEFNFPSMKHYVRLYGTFQTGTLGVGFVMFAPFKAAWNGWATDFEPVVSSLPTYTGQSFTVGPFTGIVGFNTNSPYVSGSNAQSVESRLVAAGIRVRNITPVTSRGGSLVGAETLNHTSLSGQTMGSIMLQDTSKPLPHSNGEWNCVTYHPEDPVEITWINSGAAGGGAPYTNHFLGFIASNHSGVSGNSQIFEYECCAVFEAKGTIVHGLMPSQSDPQGFANVQNILSTPDARKPYTETYDSWGRLAGTVGAVVGAGVNAYRAYHSVRRSLPQSRGNRIEYGVPVIQEID